LKVRSAKTSICNRQYDETREMSVFILDEHVEQVTDFKYLGHHISEYKSDLEDKLQTYNKINGAIPRHFGKQMNKTKQKKLRGLSPRANYTDRAAAAGRRS